MKITFKDLEEADCESVTDYCRLLIKQGSSKKTLEVYRGEMLCLTVDVREASKLNVLENKNEGPRFVKYKDTSMSEETKARLSFKRQNKGVRAPQGEV